ncbi:MAG: hypothetical protein AAB367_01335 [Patescibacteria group bacterium]
MPPNQERRDVFIRTMKTDAEQLLQRDQVSFADIYAQQQKSIKAGDYQIAPRRSAPGIAPRILGVFLFIMLLLGAAGGGYYFFVLKNPNAGGGGAPIAGPEYPRPIINSQTTSVIQYRRGDRTGLFQELERFGRQNADNTFVYLPVLSADAGKEYALTSPKEFLETLEIFPPSGDFYTNLTGEWNTYYYGSDLVFIFGIKNEGAIRGTMFSWETTLMRQFASLLRERDPGIIEFNDTIIRNTDARFGRYGEASQRIVGYGIARKELLVIATSERSLKAAIERLVVR